mgnify:CR=1 FL=1
MAAKDRKTIRRSVHNRIRKKIKGTAERPRLAVYFSNRNVYAQLIDDEKGCTITSASTKEKGFGETKASVRVSREGEGPRRRRPREGPQILIIDATDSHGRSYTQHYGLLHRIR